MKYYNFKARQAGMTLIELTVVLLVLIGLAGLMIPYVSGFVSKTHDSTGDSNLAALNDAFARFEAQYGAFPDDLQNLVNASAATSNPNVLYAQLIPTVSTTAPVLEAKTLSANAITSLSDAGITQVQSINDAAETGTASATFAIAGGAQTISVGDKVAVVGLGSETMMDGDKYANIEDHLADAFGAAKASFNAACYDYVVMGVGQESQLTGHTINDAPIHFATDGNMGPEQKYNRFVAVFEVQKIAGSASATTNSGAGGTGYASLSCPASIQPAKFIGTAMIMMPHHLFGLSHSLGHTYENRAADTVS